MKQLILAFGVVMMVSGTLFVLEKPELHTATAEPEPIYVRATPFATSTPIPKPTPTPLPIDDPSLPTVVVNKQRPLPEGFVPDELVAPKVTLRYSASAEHMKLAPEAAAALETLFAAANDESISLIVMSAYRSEATQRRIYNNYKAAAGVAKADVTTARPGYSEHQTGFAVDLAGVSRTCALVTCFANTKESQWLAANAHRFGYIVRYPGGNTEIPGYVYEPWHFRYVGTELAKTLFEKGVTMEEHFGLPSAPDYP